LSTNAILVTGGAGYIGSHVVRQLGDAGERVVVLDNLGKGFRQAVTAGELAVGDVGDQGLVSRLLAEHGVDTVMHFAAHTVVPESVALPLKYYGNNTCATRGLLQACLDNGVRHVVFSSTAAVYGIPEGGYAGEESPTRPINAYGTSKLMSEWMLRDVAAVNPLRYVALRYFNVAGSDPTGRVGQATPGATLLTKVACEAMVGKRPHVSVFGTDYPTPDGTCIRDYTNVVDLAEAHVKALQHLQAGNPSFTVNLGTGEGSSVKEVIAAVEEVTGKKVPRKIVPRRPGDPPALVGDPTRAQQLLQWKTKRSLRDSVSTAWKWMERRGK
jgi:UDP-glucose 4-epimerase